jgi:hypothetical protein
MARLILVLVERIRGEIGPDFVLYNYIYRRQVRSVDAYIAGSTF